MQLFLYNEGGICKKKCTFVSKYPSLRKRQMDITRQRPTAH